MPPGYMPLPPRFECTRCTVFMPDCTLPSARIFHLRHHVLDDKIEATSAELAHFEAVNCKDCKLPWCAKLDGNAHAHKCS